MKSWCIAIVTASVMAATSNIAFATSDTIEKRQSLMRSAREAVKVSAAMAKGEMEYDSVKAVLAMNLLYAAATGVGPYFGEDDSADLDTEAGPKIWSDRAGFETAVATFAADAAAGIKTAGESADAFKAAFGKVAGNCKACHDAYRVKK